MQMEVIIAHFFYLFINNKRKRRSQVFFHTQSNQISHSHSHTHVRRQQHPHSHTHSQIHVLGAKLHAEKLVEHFLTHLHSLTQTCTPG